MQLSGQGIDSTLINLRHIHSWPKSLQKDSALVYQYDYLAEAYSGSNDSLAKIYIDSLHQKLNKPTWNKTEGLYLRALGKYHDRRGEFKEALNAYTNAIESLEKKYGLKIENISVLDNVEDSATSKKDIDIDDEKNNQVEDITKGKQMLQKLKLQLLYIRVIEIFCVLVLCGALLLLLPGQILILKQVSLSAYVLAFHPQFLVSLYCS